MQKRRTSTSQKKPNHREEAINDLRIMGAKDVRRYKPNKLPDEKLKEVHDEITGTEEGEQGALANIKLLPFDYDKVSLDSFIIVIGLVFT
jgi:hypothetical protein